MKNIKRWFLGLFSTLFLAAGLVRAADTFDPVNRELDVAKSVSIAGSPDSVNACDIADDLKLSASPDSVNACDIADDLK